MGRMQRESNLHLSCLHDLAHGPEGLPNKNEKKAESQSSSIALDDYHIRGRADMSRIAGPVGCGRFLRLSGEGFGCLFLSLNKQLVGWLALATPELAGRTNCTQFLLGMKLQDTFRRGTLIVNSLT
jgi:hypothetical protein